MILYILSDYCFLLCKKCHGSFIKIILNLWIALCTLSLFTILILSIYKFGISFHLFEWNKLSLNQFWWAFCFWKLAQIFLYVPIFFWQVIVYHILMLFFSFMPYQLWFLFFPFLFSLSGSSPFSPINPFQTFFYTVHPFKRASLEFLCSIFKSFVFPLIFISFLLMNKLQIFFQNLLCGSLDLKIF